MDASSSVPVRMYTSLFGLFRIQESSFLVLGLRSDHRPGELRSAVAHTAWTNSLVLAYTLARRPTLPSSSLLAQIQTRYPRTDGAQNIWVFLLESRRISIREALI